MPSSTAGLPPTTTDPLEQLVARGRQRGYVTYEEINDTMPMPDDDGAPVDQTAEIDRWLKRIMDAGIEVRES